VPQYFLTWSETVPPNSNVRFPQHIRVYRALLEFVIEKFAWYYLLSKRLLVSRESYLHKFHVERYVFFDSYVSWTELLCYHILLVVTLFIFTFWAQLLLLLLLLLLMRWNLSKVMQFVNTVRRYVAMFGTFAVFNHLDSKGNYSATSNNTKLVHWPLMGGL